MRINKLDLMKFGHFTDYTIEFYRDKPFNIIFGPDESGKTTILNAVSSLFYGIPRNTAYDYQHGSPVIGAEFEYADGQVISYQRKKGARTISLYEGEKDKDKKIAEKADGIKNEMEEETFRNMFALDHRILREGGRALMEVGGELGQSLFIASSGINNLQIVQKALEDSIDSIYKPTARKTSEINRLLIQLKEQDKLIKEKSLKLDEFKKSELEFAESQKELKECKREFKMLNIEDSRMRRMSILLQPANQYREAMNARAELGLFDYLPEKISQERESLQKKLDDVLRQYESLKKEIDKILESREQIHVPEQIIFCQEQIKELKEELGQYREARRNAPEKKRDSENYEEQAWSLIRKLQPGVDSLSEVERLRLSLEEVETIKGMAQLWSELENEQNYLHKEISKNDLDIKGNEKKFLEFPELRDSLPIKKVLDEVQRQGDIEKSLFDHKIELSQREADFDGAYQAFPLWVGETAALLSTKIPLEATLRKYEGLYKEIEDKLQELDIIIKQNRTEVEKNQLALAELQEKGDIPEENLLMDARAQRQLGWSIVKKVLADERDSQAELLYTAGLKLENVYETDVEKADGIADQMRREADRAAQRNKLRASIGDTNKKLGEYQTERDFIFRERVRLDEQWQLEWHDIPVERVLSPMEMRSWVTVFAEVRKQYQDIEQARIRKQEIERGYEEAKSMLIEVLPGIEAIKREESLKSLTSICQEMISDVDKVNHDYNGLTQQIQKDRDYGEKLGQEMKSQAAKIESWQGNWAAWMDKAGLDRNALPSTALAYIDTLRQMFDLLDKKNFSEREYLSSLEFIEHFEKRVNYLAETTGMADPVLTPEQKVARMDEVRERAEQDKVLLEEKDKNLKNKEKELRETEYAIQEYEEEMKRLLAKVRCIDVEQMKEQEQRSLRAREQDQKIETARDILVANLPDTSTSVEELLKELENIDADQLQAEIMTLGETINLQESRKEEASARYLQADYKYSELNRNVSEEAALAAQEAQEITARIKNLTEDYVRLKIARKILADSIISYSCKNQNYIIERAGEIFARLTLNSFSGLKVGQNESYREVLLGMRSSGDELVIEEMSEGTQDQLYLAIRLANIEQFITNNRPIPLIMDDLLINFDDERAQAALGVMEELSYKLQIIYFTHHQHIKEMAEKQISPGILKIQNISL